MQGDGIYCGMSEGWAERNYLLCRAGCIRLLAFFFLTSVTLSLEMRMVGFLWCTSQFGTAFTWFTLLISPNFGINCESLSSLSCCGCASWRGASCLLPLLFWRSTIGLFEQFDGFFANLSCADWRGEVGLAHVAPHFWGGDHLQAGAWCTKVLTLAPCASRGGINADFTTTFWWCINSQLV